MYYFECFLACMEMGLSSNFNYVRRSGIQWRNKCFYKINFQYKRDPACESENTGIHKNVEVKHSWLLDRVLIGCGCPFSCSVTLFFRQTTKWKSRQEIYFLNLDKICIFRAHCHVVFSDTLCWTKFFSQKKTFQIFLSKILKDHLTFFSILFFWNGSDN